MMSISRPLRIVRLRQIHTSPITAVATARPFSGAYTRGRDVGGGGGSGSSLNFFGKPRLPANKGIMFVPQQEAWVCHFRLPSGLL